MTVRNIAAAPVATATLALVLTLAGAPLAAAQTASAPKGSLERITVHGRSLEVYDGDHGNRIGERFASHVLPFFSRHLATTP